ncbi:phosphoribosylamine--glycine ligase [Leuconostoc litchii]|uniref:Phosphoribosylamine--glycine ligase n=1 Tax=Leuconostoc litchii TaxID=1981069 RepID=A0A6P2CSJ2_9LACO|nr:phosphoribosylamine--glycine ligase [Leuconostoc litchii]TYC47237.1 phosphoribosylamine--glycine ligase [Leuconostoc litchii]GMA69219.1 phosphoribosylamine--glycine ligase [Leuconostoc litchii]
MAKVLIVGSGAREHALAQTFLRSEQVEEVVVAPGNDGMIDEHLRRVQLPVTNLIGLRDFAIQEQIDLTFVGNEEPLTLGIVDVFRAANLSIFGPTKAAAQLEGSKSFTKHILKKYDIPTAKSHTVTTILEAEDVVRQFKFPIVFKIDGLALGKGVTIINSIEEVDKYLKEIYQADNQAKLVIEEYLEGVEFSIFTLVGRDGIMVHTPLAQDHKRRYDGDKGPNTGGMGAYSPVNWISKKIRQRAVDTLVMPTIQAMRTEQTPFTGVLYTGVMLTKEGPKVIEFNVRFGDPEAQVVLPQYKGDFYNLIWQLLSGKNPATNWQEEEVYLGVVLAADGYPEYPIKGAVVPDIPLLTNYAGVKSKEDKLVASGGRVATVIVHDKSVKLAQEKVYNILDKTPMDLKYRHDIAYQATKKM